MWVSARSTAAGDGHGRKRTWVIASSMVGLVALVAMFAIGVTAEAANATNANTPTLSFDSFNGSRSCTPRPADPSNGDPGAAGGFVPVTVIIGNVIRPHAYIAFDADGKQVYYDGQQAFADDIGPSTLSWTLGVDSPTLYPYTQSLVVTPFDNNGYNPSNVITFDVPGCPGYEVTPTPTPTPTDSTSPSPSPTDTVSPTPTATVSPTPSPTASPTPLAPVARLSVSFNAGPYATTTARLNASTSSGPRNSYEFHCGNGQGHNGVTNLFDCKYTKASKYIASVTVYGPGGSSMKYLTIPVGARVPRTIKGESIQYARSELYKIGIHPGDNITGKTPPRGYRYSFAYYAFKTSAGYPKVSYDQPIKYGQLVYIICRLVRA